MAYLMGIDIGTSSVKTIISDEKGYIKAACSRSYQYDSPIVGYAEQDADVWWKAAVETIREALCKSGITGDDVRGVGFSGQMHGLVALDENNEVIRPVILHCDVRSEKQVKQLKEFLGKERVKRLLLNQIYTGFLFVSLLWVKENEPHNYNRIKKVCLPKDYIKYKLSGVLSSDYSDASATLAYDIIKNDWSDEILRLADIPRDFFPELSSIYQAVGAVTKEAADETGLSVKTIVVAGGGDQVMQGIGNGAVRKGQATVNIGSSGQVCFQSDYPVLNDELSTNIFCGYKNGHWIVMGAIMYAGLSLKWLNRIFDGSDYGKMDEMAEKVNPGSGGVVFLPYLNGERSPHTNPNLSATFIGINQQTGRPELARAVMEGVTFALADCMEVCGKAGLSAKTIVASGGGAKSRLWLQIQADTFGLPISVAENEEQACLGAAIAAGVGAGVYGSIEEGIAASVRYRKEIIEPNKLNHETYLQYFSVYKDIYVQNKEILERIYVLRNS